MKTKLVTLISTASRFLTMLSIFACAFAARAAEPYTWLDADFENGITSGWAAYYTTNPANLSIATDGGGANHYLNVTSSIAYRGTYALLPNAVTLAEGNTLSVSFRLMFTSVSTEVRFGLFNYAGGDMDSGGLGYFTTVSEGATAPSGLARDYSAANPGSGNSNAITATTTNATTAFAANTWYDASFTLKVISKPETGNTSMQITTTIGDSSVTATRTGANYFDFGMFYIGSGNNNARFAIDDVLVTSNIPTPVPEPATFATLAGIGALVVAALLIRRRQS